MYSKQITAPTLAASYKVNQVLVICPKTGIQSSLVVEACPGKVLEHKHPLSDYAVAKEIVAEGIAYLRKLEPSLLAGLILTIYRRFDLIARGRETAIEENRLLQSAGIEVLIQALSLSRQFTETRLEYAPQFSLDWATYQNAPNLASSFLSYTRTIGDLINPPAQTKTEINTLPAKLKLLTSTSRPPKSFEEEFKRVKAEAKLILQDIILESKLKAYLIQIFTKRNLLLINDELRAKIAAKLDILNHSRLASLVRDTIDPTADIFASVDSALESGLESMNRPKKSLAEIIAEKKAKESRGFIKMEKESEEPKESEILEEEDFGLAEEVPFIDPLEDSEEEAIEELQDLPNGYNGEEEPEENSEETFFSVSENFDDTY